MPSKLLKIFSASIFTFFLLAGLGRKALLHRVSDSGYAETIELQVKPHHKQEVHTELKGFTTIVLEFPEFTELIDFYLLTPHGDSFPVRILTRPELNEPRRSAMFMTDHKNRELTVYSGNYKGPLKIFLVGAPPLSIQTPQILYKSGSECSKPAFIASEIWREGLPDPVPGRTVQKVDHLIVHHSAGSNNVTDFTQAVRNIYLYHLEVNGWDDVGYNYLIAPNGQVYQGRDDLGEGPEDNIKGAHFCGKNTGTMGVCLMGNYDEVEVPDSAFSSLIQLLTWKSVKENMDPREYIIHPPGGSETLGRIAGHRDGCATRCPGDNAYALLDELKDSVYNRFVKCAPATSIIRENVQDLVISPNPVAFPMDLDIPGKGHSLFYRILNMEGKTLYENRVVGKTIDPDIRLNGGYYFLEVTNRDNGILYVGKFAVNPP